MSQFSIMMAGCTTSSPVLPRVARQWLGVCAAFRIPKTGPQLRTFGITHSGALEKRQCIMAQRVWALMEPVVLSFVHLRTRAKSR